MYQFSENECAFCPAQISPEQRDRKPEEGLRTSTPHGGHNAGDNLLDQLFAQAPDAQLLFVGSVNCLRHKPYMGIGKLMQAGKACVLSPTMTDFSTGRYLHQITDAIAELSRERNCRRFILSFGCQWVILSTDEEIIRRELQEDYGIELIIFDDSHLEFGDHQ